MADKIRMGLVGCGAYGEAHLSALRGIRTAEVGAVFDIDPARAARVADRFGVPRVCRSLAELCALPDLQAVDVVTPEPDHLPSVLAAFGAGKHVFLEKPMATDLGECRRMIDAARAAKRSLMVGHIVRFEPKYALLREEAASGRLGRLVSLHARRNRMKSLLSTYNTRCHPVVEHCVHDIDIMLWTVGRPVKKVRGWGRNGSGSRHPDTFWGVLEFDGGALGVIETIWLLPPKAGVVLDDAFQVVGDRGVGTVSLVPGGLTFWREDGAFTPDVQYDPVYAGAARGALRDELTHFTESLLDGREPDRVTPVDAMRAVRVALALKLSADEGRDVEIGEWDA